MALGFNQDDAAAMTDSLWGPPGILNATLPFVGRSFDQINTVFETRAAFRKHEVHVKLQLLNFVSIVIIFLACRTGLYGKKESFSFLVNRPSLLAGPGRSGWT